jgi:hypothetical protein
MFMKRLGVAAVLILCAFGAAASNFRAADQVYIPISGHAAGATGVFITDVFISNLSSDSVTVSVIFMPRIANVGGGDNPGEDLTTKIELGPNERKELLDIFPNTFGKPADVPIVGQLIFNACKKDADCGPDSQNSEGFSENFRPISVMSRIYQIPNGAGATPPTTGQDLPGVPWYSFVSSLQQDVNLDKVFITGFTHNGNPGQAGTYRSNVGIVNASQYSSTQVVARLYKNSLSEANKIAERAVDLGPLGNIQQGLSDLFPGVFPAQFGSNFFVTFEQRNNVATSNAPLDCDQGCPAFLVYGSVLDNASGDATTLESQYFVEMDPAALAALYPNGSGKGVLRRMVRKPSLAD